MKDVFMHRDKQGYSQVHVITSIDGKFGSLIIYKDSFSKKHNNPWDNKTHSLIEMQKVESSLGSGTNLFVMWLKT